MDVHLIKGSVEVGEILVLQPFASHHPRLKGAQILVIPSAVPNGYEHLLKLRTRARAQDNQVFVIASNLTGNGFFGGSLIVDPRGNILESAGDGEGSISADLDLAMIKEERDKEPALRLRRTDLYR